MAQWIEGLLHKHADLGFYSKHDIKNAGMAAYACNLSSGKQRREDIGIVLSRLSTWNSQPQVQREKLHMIIK